MKTQIQCAALLAASLLSTAAFHANAQAGSTPIKAGLWQTDSSMTNKISLPADVEAKIAAMPAAQQAQVRAMMSNGASSQPTAVSHKACMAGQTSVDSMLGQEQQRSGMRCTFTNRVETASNVSFDTSCTGAEGQATGHTQLHMTDSDHVAGTMHLTVEIASKGHTSHMVIDDTMSAKYLGPDCGDVKPFSPPAK